MAEQLERLPMDVIDAYYARFGREADFDRWAMGETVSVQLMEEALQRGSPVTLADLERKHQEVFGEPYPGDPPEGAVT